jgi:hypothetical protein
MNFVSPTASAEPPRDPFLDREEARIWKLSRLSDLAMKVAEEIGARILGEAPAAVEPVFGTTDLGLAFTRAARAVRQTVAMETKYDEARRARETRTRAEEAARLAEIEAERERREAYAQRRAEMHKKSTVEQAVKRVIETEDDPSDIEYLLTDLVERLAQLDDDPDLLDLPIGALAIRFCDQMGLDLHLSVWADEPWAIEEMRTKPAGSPFVEWPPDPEEDAELEEDAEPEDLAAGGPILAPSGGGGRGPP